METKTQLIARYQETDQMGIVHHSNYPIWFEAGRTDFFKKIGMANSDIELKGILCPLINMECAFKIPVKYEDEIFIKTKVKSMTCVRVEFIYEVISCKDGVVHALGSTSHAWTDKILKPLNIEIELPVLYRLLKENI